MRALPNASGAVLDGRCRRITQFCDCVSWRRSWRSQENGLRASKSGPSAPNIVSPLRALRSDRSSVAFRILPRSSRRETSNPPLIKTAPSPHQSTKGRASRPQHNYRKCKKAVTLDALALQRATITHTAFISCSDISMRFGPARSQTGHRANACGHYS